MHVRFAPPFALLAVVACSHARGGASDPGGGIDSGSPPVGPVQVADSGGADALLLDAGPGSHTPDAASSDASVVDAFVADAAPTDAAPAPFVLRPEWTGPCTASSGAIDVNLGNSAESFVRAAYCQISGTEPADADVANWVAALTTESYVRRIDTVRTLCEDAGKSCKLAYSNPWLTDPPRNEPCVQKGRREVGAVMMFFFGCPGGTNCGEDWANTHAYGMATPDPIYGAAPDASGYYAPSNEGFWLRELLDARYAGLQFMMPNVYGFDIGPGTTAMQELESALLAIDAMSDGDGGIRIGLFNDTWAWGEAPGGALMNPAPDLSDTDASAQRIYSVEWKPFFSALSRTHWYTVNGAPLIYFYNAGTLVPVSGASAVIAEMKELFQADFGVTPFVAVDRGYGPTASADSTFVWDTFANDPGVYVNVETTITGGRTWDNAMVKWDSLGRDAPGAIADGGVRLFKGTAILEQVLDASASADLLLLETWNDLGEGTGITRNYDYYVDGGWMPPDTFMQILRASQCSN